MSGCRMWAGVGDGGRILGGLGEAGELSLERGVKGFAMPECFATPRLVLRDLEPDGDRMPARLRAWSLSASGGSPNESSVSSSSTAQLLPIESTLGLRAAAAMAA